jgi:hypothetical protein
MKALSIPTLRAAAAACLPSLLASACHSTGTGGPAAEPPGPAVDAPTLPAYCAAAPVPPPSLECTGLYLDVAAKTLAPGVRAYRPAFSLWSDGSEKQRWVVLPPGTMIDSSNANEWIFPVGTKFFKEFSKSHRRIETRMWQKAGNNFWVNAVYAWNDEETAAQRTAGGDVKVSDGSGYHIPLQEECEKCHRGRTERILGFAAVDLGLPGAAGVTLKDLVAEARLSLVPPSTRLSLGDDGTGIAAPVLGWLHANCGTTCHNDNPRATGYATGLRLRLDPSELDGRPTSRFDAYRTTVGFAARTPKWRDRTRIVAGRPEESLLHYLIAHRGVGEQMPPIASNEVDPIHSVLVGEWIRRMPSSSTPDAGAPD